jgi:hypothetical protein
MKTVRIVAKNSGKEEASHFLLFEELIKEATNATDITRVHIVDKNGAVLYTRWMINK